MSLCEIFEIDVLTQLRNLLINTDVKVGQGISN